MTTYKCECGKEEKEISKATIVLRDGKWVAKEALCGCGKYMDSEPAEGMPDLIRTEPSLSTKTCYITSYVFITINSFRFK